MPLGGDWRMQFVSVLLCLSCITLMDPLTSHPPPSCILSPFLFTCDLSPHTYWSFYVKMNGAGRVFEHYFQSVSTVMDSCIISSPLMFTSCRFFFLYPLTAAFTDHSAPLRWKALVENAVLCLYRPSADISGSSLTPPRAEHESLFSSPLFSAMLLLFEMPACQWASEATVASAA